MFNRVSADGYFSTPDGKLDWTVPDAEIDKEGASGTQTTDTILFGRRTYEMFEQFWPNVRDDASTAPDPHTPGRYAPEMLAFAKMINAATKIVFSTTRKEVSWKNSQLLHEFDPTEIEAMKQRPGKDMIIFGSGTIVSQLTEHALIDEYTFVVSPILLGDGKQPIRDISKNAKLKLIEARMYPSGNVKLRYAPSR